MRFEVIQGEALEVMRGMADASASLAVCDPPYFRVKDEDWDNQWRTPEDYLKWMGVLCAELKRVLAPNGSLYLFASPQLARQVGNVVAEHFNILTDVRWRKPEFSTKAEMFRKEDMRSYFPASETIFFAEQFGADSYAMGEGEAFIYAPLLDYLNAERLRAGWMKSEIDKAWQRHRGTNGFMATHWFGRHVQWMPPTREQYEWLRTLFGGDYLRRPYEGIVREYEALSEEYAALRRPFTVSPDVPYTDVWTFPTVNTYSGKHPCEKPPAMFEHIIGASSREGDLVLDPFAGSFHSGVAALALGRRFIGVDGSAKWCEQGRRKLSAFGAEGSASVHSVVEFRRAHARPAPVDRVLPLFAEAMSPKVTGQPLSTIALRIDQPGNTDSVPPGVTIRNNGSVAHPAEVVQA